ncbi:hypothetical protein ACIBG7_15255 [Nonomuraea sp. NPDC050328]|uniref:hypothetical protein n=1 Tax=Nonomuraea sp. NPDC050328 TaxID=3364361 RepID=UPI0037A93AD5
MGLQGYTPADLARLKSIQTNAGATKPDVREPIVNGRRVRIVRRRTDAPGVLVLTREYHRVHGDHKDVEVRVPLIRARLGGRR